VVGGDMHIYMHIYMQGVLVSGSVSTDGNSNSSMAG